MHQKPNGLAPGLELGAAIPARQPPPAPAGRGNLYLLSWAVVALAAGTYLAAVVFKPKILADWFPAIDRALTQPQGNDQNRSAAIAEAAQLRANLAEAREEVQRLRQELGESDARVKSAELRISGLEKELQGLRSGVPQETASITPQVTPAPETAATSQTAQAGNTPRTLAESIGAPRSFELVNGAPMAVPQPPTSFGEAAPGGEIDVPLPERRPAISRRTPITQLVRPTVAVAPSGSNSMETGSVAAPAALAGSEPQPSQSTEPITFGAPVVTRSTSQYGVRLTAGPSVDALRLSWSLMSERYIAELGGLQPRYVTGSAPAAPYALVAGPLTSEQEAHRVCGALITKGIPCSVDSFVGNAL